MYKNIHIDVWKSISDCCKVFNKRFWTKIFVETKEPTCGGGFLPWASEEIIHFPFQFLHDYRPTDILFDTIHSFLWKQNLYGLFDAIKNVLWTKFDGENTRKIHSSLKLFLFLFLFTYPRRKLFYFFGFKLSWKSFLTKMFLFFRFPISQFSHTVKYYFIAIMSHHF